MNVQHQYQLLQRRSMNQLSNLAQAHHGTITQQLDELNELHTAQMPKLTCWLSAM
jgi:hypothetical protein